MLFAILWGDWFDKSIKDFYSWLYAKVINIIAQFY